MYLVKYVLKNVAFLMLKFKSKLVLLPGQIAIKEILRLERKMWKRNKKKMKRQCLVYFVS